MTASDERLIAALRELIPRAMSHGGVPGLSIAIGRRGEVIWSEGFGVADIPSGRPMLEGTVGWAGSMSKPYTAVAVLQQVEEGRLALDADISEYLDFDFTNPLGDRPISIRDLMLHRSGLTSDTGGCDHYTVAPLDQFLEAGSTSDRLDEYEGSVRRWSAKVGEIFQYSNFGASLVGYAVQRVNAEKLEFSDYVRERILSPLGMTESDFPASGEAHAVIRSLPDFSSGYAGYGQLLVATPPIHLAAYPAGALLTTARDHLKFILALAGGGEFAGVRILEEESVAEMLTPGIELGLGRQNGLLVGVRDQGELSEGFGHGGAYMWGWTNGGGAFPRVDLGIVVLTNRWDMVRYLDSGAVEAPELIIRFAGEWSVREAAGHPTLPEKTWAWKSSYAAGLSLAERTKGVLGIENALPPEVLSDVIAATPPQENWDADGFASGVADMLRVRQRPDSVSEFLASPDVQVSHAELELIHQEMGGQGPFALVPELGSLLIGVPDPLPLNELVIE